MKSLFGNGYKGLSDTRFSGLQGSVYHSVGIDHRTKPGLLGVHQKMTKQSSNVVGELCLAAVNVSDGSRLWFSRESNKIWREVAGTYTLVSENAIDLFSLIGISDSVGTFNASSFAAYPIFYIGNNGAKLYVLKSGENQIREYNLTTAWDITTATTVQTVSLSGRSNGCGLFFSNDGTKMFFAQNDTKSVYQYTLGTAWNISTQSYNSLLLNTSAKVNIMRGIAFSSNGLNLYVVSSGTGNNKVYQYQLPVAWSLNASSYMVELDLAPTGSIFPIGVAINPVSTRLYVASLSPAASSKIYQYNLATVADISTGTLVSSKTIISGSTPASTVAFRSDGSSFYVSYVNIGLIQQFNTLAPDDNKNLSAAEFFVSTTNGDIAYIYYATEKYLYRIPTTGIANWAVNYEVNAVFQNGDTEFHPMVEQNGRLYIGDKFIIAEVNELGVVTLETDFNVPANERIVMLIDFDIDVLVGTKTLNAGRVLRWDGVSVSWSAEDDIYVKGGVSAFLKDDNYVYVLDEEGTIWFYNGERCEVFARIPEVGDGKIKINPKSVGYWRKTPIFGLSNGENNTVLQGIYGLGKYSQGYSTTLSLDFPVSSNEFSGVEIGAIIVDGKDIYVSWKSGTGVGVDKLDYTAKYAGAYMETTLLSSPSERHQVKTLTDAVVPYYSLPANTNITIGIQKAYEGTYTNMAVTNDTIRKTISLANPTVPNCANPQLRVGFTISGNTAPEIEDVIYEIAPLGKR